MASKIRYYEYARASRGGNYSAPWHCQIIALSATVKNLNELSKWIDAKVFVTEWRPVVIRERVIAGNQVLDAPSGAIIGEIACQSKKAIQIIPEVCFQNCEQRLQTLVFCPSRASCVAIANNVAKRLPTQSHPQTDRSVELAELIASLKEHDYSMDSSTEEMIYKGIMFHHAGILFK